MLSCFKFLFKMHFCIFFQKLLQKHFREKLATKLFPQKEVKAKTGKHKFQTETLATVSRLKNSREKLCASDVFFVSTFVSM